MWRPIELAVFRILPRRAKALTFNASESCILVADKSGDVRQFNVCDTDPSSDKTDDSSEDNASLVLGHISMLLDLVRSYFIVI